jgi:uncharacterized protein YcbK (DUF882 family)
MSAIHLTRRAFIRRVVALGAGAPLVMASRSARSTPAATRTLELEHLHTRERIAIVFASGSTYVRSALGSLNRFLRDHYTGEITNIDHALFDQLFELRRTLGINAGVNAPFQVVSGYRSPATNAMLLQRGGKVALDSLHIQGRAIDIRLAGVTLTELRDAAKSMRLGGVGFYPASNFLHLDTGRIRSW